MSIEALERCVAKMRNAGVSQPAIDNFTHYWHLCAAGASGLIAEDTIRPLLEVPSLDSVAVDEADARAALRQTVLIKLNGGLGTSMGLDRAKTLLTVRDGRNFLDLIVAQVQHARSAYDARLPLLFMNSFRTRQDTLDYLADVPGLAVDGLPLDFLQNAEPKILVEDLSPVDWPTDPSLEWCPPGHGDLYPALLGSGVLDALIAAGFRYASVANGDNLGAAPDARLAGWFAASGAPYAAELCPRTVNDRKGGHLALRISDEQLILRDTAQTAPEDMGFFTDEHRHPFFHTNNLWLDLVQLRAVLTERAGVLGLPLIRNEKTVDPAVPSSPKVIQLESAMGAAIEVFVGAKAIVVPRDRFLPVKTTNELLLLRSDVFELGPDGRLIAVADIPEISLDPKHYRLVGDFDQLVSVVPSLRRAKALRVQGEWHFDSPTEIVGELELADTGTGGYYR
ncbi:MAG: UTP--glucose-1-phosphate uridylyltransferase [Actinobacteria bacterium]|nr:UTP--glucose-1-phosphate uridylyltransferase [Propionicimonas sp.]MBU3975372.1 UTP--glucose-1-phosphate uridylyltransferase [Actinomycetota bacterium]MBU3986479.1 UTP--glucose-1-phosphate uridylyltransferase [Actinomycetota bacterium]MBU4008048.1 UTP--glucose-1-phosphate uridylyltransferase [Actinomycetota bacterium]MBU4064306.1 UTP--glucose-1-phosphate uridylyltransferase [Actinomycetota bacterium]